MEDTNKLIEQRRKKLNDLRAQGINPFANKFRPSTSCADARENYPACGTAEVAVAGRLVSHRLMGKTQFAHVKDQSGKLQLFAQKQVLGDEAFERFKHLDLGDILGAKGTLFKTKTGEISVRVSEFAILSKALRPPPEKWHGLADTEIRYRQRYLDLIANDEVKEVFLKRSQIIHEIRRFFHERGYVEVETPMMQSIPGGAAAQPFVTHHNSLGCDFYLRIALELYLKRLLVGGMDKVFEIGRNFRNEGLSRRHNPEFTMLEAYEAYGDYESMMELVESLVCHVAERVLRTTKIKHDLSNELENQLNFALRCLNQAKEALQVIGYEQVRTEWQNYMVEAEQEIRECKSLVGGEPYHVIGSRAKDSLEHTKSKLVEDFKSHDANFRKELIGHFGSLVIGEFEMSLRYLKPLAVEKIINLSRPWPRVKYKDIVKERAGDDWFDITPAERRKRAEKLGAEFGEEYEDFEVTQAVFEKLIEPTLIQPTFVTHAPKELIPLAKLSPDDPTTVEVFECCINGQEIAPGYTEQNDPIEQRERLEHQAGGEQQKLDEDFLVALEHGMPPAGGIGMGIDRLCMMLLGQESIRDVILFPQLKPK